MTQVTERVVASEGIIRPCHPVPGCSCIGPQGSDGWHDEIVSVFSAPPEFLEWGARLVTLGIQAGADRELTHVAGVHDWPDRSAVYDLACALEELAEGLYYAAKPGQAASS